MNDGALVRAIYEFVTDIEGELPLHVGDIIQVHHTVDKHWLIGSQGGRKGRFPSSFVIEEAFPQCDNECTIFVASENFVATERGDLGFNKGNIIIGTNQVDQNWWRGKCNGKDGIFPVTHVWRVDKTLFKKLCTKGQKVNLKARVCMDMKAQLDEEMDLRTGDIITITEIVDEDWYRGECDDKSGIFPSSFVVLLDEESCRRRSQCTVTETICALPENTVFLVKEEINPQSDSIDCDNVTSNRSSPSGYHCDNSGITPYGRTLFSFAAQYPDELSFEPGEILNLLRHVDNQWMEGEIDGRIGFFPKTHIEIVVDCSDRKQTDNFAAHTPLVTSNVDIIPGVTEGRVLYDYVAQTPEDLNLVEDELITIIRKLNSDWYEARDCQGSIGLCPSNYVALRETTTPPSLQRNNNNTQNKMYSDLVSLDRFQSTNVNNTNLENHNLHSKSNDKVNNGNISVIPNDILDFDPFSNRATDKSSNSIHVITPSEDSDTFLKENLVGKPRSASDLSPLESSIAQNIANLDHSSLKSCTSSSVRMHVPARSSSFSGKMYESKATTVPSLPRQTSFHDNRSSGSTLMKSRSQSSASSVRAPLSKHEVAQIAARLRSSSYGSAMPPPRPPPPSASQPLTNATPDLIASTTHFSAPPPIPPPPVIPSDAPPSLPPSSSHVQRISSLPPPIPPPPLIPSDKESGTSHHVVSNPQLPSVPYPLRTAPPPPSDQLKRPPPNLQHSLQRQSTLPPTNYVLPSRDSTLDSASRPRVPHRPAPPVPLYPQRRSSSIGAPGTAVFELQRKINERERNLKQLKSAKHELESHISTQRQSSQSPMQDQVKAYEETLNGLSSEISSLKESIQRVASQKESTFQGNGAHSEELQSQEEEANRQASEYKQKNLDRRRMVITELLQTERDYYRDLKLVYDTFLSNSEEGKSKGVDMEVLFGNIEQIIKLAEQLLNSVEKATIGTEPQDIVIGPCFQQVSEEMKEVYGHYCSNHDEVIQLIDKYQDNPEIQDYFMQKLDVIRERTSCFNLGALLIKPVQRILKYPLLLNELIKCTEDDNPDMIELQKAIQVMTDVATAINEYKRRKDLVVKYRKEADTSLSTMFSKLNLHSVVKKSARIGMRLSSHIGLTTVTKDEAFDEEEQKFRSLDKTVRAFIKDVTAFSMQLQEWVKSQFYTGEDIGSFYMDNCNRSDVDQYRTVQRELYQTLWIDFKNTVAKRVIGPLTDLLQTFQGPTKLIDKRLDKLLDYDSSSLRMEKNKDISKARLLSEEQQLTKNTYEALNAQLLEELPKLFSLGLDIFQGCVCEFMIARKRFTGRYAKLILPLMELPNLQSARGDVLDAFNALHSQAAAKLASLTFLPKNFFPPKAEPPGKEKVEKKTKMANQSQTQSEANKNKVQSSYPATSLYCAMQPHQPADGFEAALVIGDIVGVIKKQDPMGSSNRWFVDTGATKGFVPVACLSQLHADSPSSVPTYFPAAGGILVPTRAPPPAPSPTPASSRQSGFLPGVKSGYSHLPSQQVLPGQPTPTLQPAPAPPHNPAVYGNIPAESDSDRYDEPCESTAHDLYSSERYDVPFDGAEADLLGLQSDSTSSLKTEQQPGSLQTSIQQVTEGEYFFATYEFHANTASELSLSQGQVVLVIHKQDMEGNLEWWFVQDRYHNQGFVPANYLSKYES